MAGSEVRKSPAFGVLSVGGRKVLRAVADEVRRGGSAISLDTLMGETDLCRSSVRRGIKQAEALGLISVTMGPRHNNLFQLSDGWRAIDAGEAARLAKLSRLPTPPRATSVPPRAVKTAKVPVAEVVEQPQRYTPSLPQLRWLRRGGFDHRAT